MGGSKISSAVISIAPIFLGNLIICSSFICVSILLFLLQYLIKLFYEPPPPVYNRSDANSQKQRCPDALYNFSTKSTNYEVVIAFVLLAECICMHCKMYLSQFKKGFIAGMQIPRNSADVKTLCTSFQQKVQITKL